MQGPPYSIFVGGLAYEMTNDILMEAFAEYESVTDANVIMDYETN